MRELKMIKGVSVGWMAALLLAGCTNTDGVKTGNIQFYDPITLNNLSGVTVDAGMGQAISGDDGWAEFDASGEGAIEVVITAESRPKHTLYLTGWGESWTLTYGVISTEQIGSIATEIGAVPDPQKGIVQVAALWENLIGTTRGMTGASISVDAAYDVAVTETMNGWAVVDSGTLGVGDMAMLSFANVEPGQARIDVGLPDGASASSCGSYPSSTEDAHGGVVDVVAGEVSAYLMICSGQ